MPLPNCVSWQFAKLFALSIATVCNAAFLTHRQVWAQKGDAAQQGAGQQEVPDIRDVQPDLQVPELQEKTPAAGHRVKVHLSGYPDSVYHVVYLPTNYEAAKRHPVIVEYAGNGGYVNQYGDRSEGVPEGSNLGYGLSGGRDFIWICLPFLTQDRQEIAKQWWGSPPSWSPASTVQYAKLAVADALVEYGADPTAVLLCGFSRGAIACNFIGLHDDEIARLWCGFVPYSHYDGVRKWGLPGTDADSARRRLKRLGSRPQFVVHEVNGESERGLSATRTFLEANAATASLSYAETGFRNHNDAWILRPGTARTNLRKWLHAIPAVRQSLDRLSQ